MKTMTFRKRSDVSRKRYMRTTQNVAIIFLVFCVCWVPDTVHWLIDPDYHIAPVWIIRAGVILYFSNSAINPFLFAWRFPAFRKTMMTMLSTRAQRRNSWISTYVTERRNTVVTATVPDRSDRTTSTHNALTIQTESEVPQAMNNNKVVTCYVSAM